MNRKCLQGWLGNLRNGYIVRALRPVTISGDIRLGIPYRFERSLRIVREKSSLLLSIKCIENRKIGGDILKIIGHMKISIERIFRTRDFFFVLDTLKKLFLSPVIIRSLIDLNLNNSQAKENKFQAK